MLLAKDSVMAKEKNAPEGGGSVKRSVSFGGGRCFKQVFFCFLYE